LPWPEPRWRRRLSRVNRDLEPDLAPSLDSMNISPHSVLPLLLLPILFVGCLQPPSVTPTDLARLSPIGPGWARSSVNAVIFRQSSLVSHDDVQYAAFYDPEGRM